jgi:hypothetical protein
MGGLTIYPRSYIRVEKFSVAGYLKDIAILVAKFITIKWLARPSSFITLVL